MAARRPERGLDEDIGEAAHQRTRPQAVVVAVGDGGLFTRAQFEAAVKPGSLGWGWAMFAYRTWMALDAVDRSALARVVPDEFFYNVSVTGVRP